MPQYQISVPGRGTFLVESPSELTDAQAWQAVQGQLSTTAPEQKSTITSELLRGGKQLASSVRTGIESIFSPEEAAVSGVERGQKIAEEAGEGPSLAAVRRAYEERGLLPAAGEVVSQIPRALAGQGAQIAAMAGGARLGATAGAAVAPFLGPAAPLGPLVGGALGAGATLLPQFMGANVERQAQEQMERGEPVAIDRTAAYGSAAGQAAIESAGTAFVFGKRLVKGVLGIADDAALASAKAQQELAKAASRSVAATVGRGAVRGAAEIPVEIAQAVLERAQAGLDLTSPEALSEYGENAYLAGLVGPTIGGVTSVMDRNKARAPMEGQLPGETLEQSITRLQQEILTETQPPAPPPAEPNFFNLAAQPNGYGLLEQAKQRLMQGEQTESIKSYLAEIEALQDRISTEAEARKQPTAGSLEEALGGPPVLAQEEMADILANQPSGWGQLFKYKADLLDYVKQQTQQQKAVPEGMLESLQGATDLLKQYNIDEYNRRPSGQLYESAFTPPPPPPPPVTQVDDQVARGLGFVPSKSGKGIYNQIVNKDLTDPAQLQEVRSALETYVIKGNGAESTIARVSSFLKSIPRGEADVGTPITPTSGEGAPVAIEPSAGAAAPGVGVTQPSGVVPAVEDVGLAPRGEEGKPAAIKQPGQTLIQRTDQFGADIGATRPYRGELRGRVNLQAQKAAESGNFDEVISALEKSKNATVAEVAKRAKGLGTNIVIDDNAEERYEGQSPLMRQMSIDGAKMHLEGLELIRSLAPQVDALPDNAKLPMSVGLSKIQQFDKGENVGNASLERIAEMGHSMFDPLPTGPIKLRTKEDFKALQQGFEDITQKHTEDALRLTSTGSAKMQGVAGAYDADTDTIRVPSYSAKREDVLAHEVVHAQTLKSIANPTEAQKPVVARLNNLYQHVKTTLQEKAKADKNYRLPYGLESIQEFMAEGMSNPKFQFELNEIEYKNTSAWDAFVQYVADLIGVKKDTAFTELLSVYSDMTPQIAPPPQAQKAPRSGLPDLEVGGAPAAPETAAEEEAVKPKKSLSDVPQTRWGELERRAKVSRETTTEEAPAEAVTRKITPETQEKIQQLQGLLKTLMNRFGLKDVGLNLVNDLAANGEYSKNLIKLAIDATSPVRDLRHESVHALKELGFLTPQQWAVLEKKAKDTWIDQFLKQRNVNGFALQEGEKSRYDAYVEMFTADQISPDAMQEALIEEAISDAFGEFDVNKAPAGLMQAILKRMKTFFAVIKEALGQARIESAEEIFERVEKGELQPKNAWKATPQEVQKAEKYEEKNGIAPYISEGRLDLPTKLSIKTNVDKYGVAPVLDIPLNKDGTVTVYYHTTKPQAIQFNSTKVIPAEGRNRVYLTNESSGAKVLADKGNFDQDMDGSAVLLNIHPSLLQIDQTYPDGRKDFFVPLAQGDFFNKKMQASAIQASRRKPITEVFSYADHEDRITKALNDYRNLDAKGKRDRLKKARAVLKQEHNVGTLMTENGKLEKTRIAEHGLTYDDKPIDSMGLGLASAQQISDKLSTCPNSAICEGLCLGETSGGNFLYGGAAQDDILEIEKSAFRAGPRMMQYLKTEALIIHPEEFAIVLQSEIDSLRRWDNSPTYRKRDPVTNKVMNLEKDVYKSAVRLNVTSDFKPSMWTALIEGNPDVMFYDYTKIIGNRSIADNHHLTYSSTGFGQNIDGEQVFFKTEKGKYNHNWAQVRNLLNSGKNVAMAFSSKSQLPKTLVDEETGVVYNILDGDNYDARFLDEESPLKKGLDRGVIVGLRNKAATLKEKTATKATDGFFVDYDPKRDGDSVTVPDQTEFGAPPYQAPAGKGIPIAKASLRDTNAKEFKQWFGNSQIVDEDGQPLVMYHGSARDITTFRGKQAGAIFLTEDPGFAEVFSEDSLSWMARHADQFLNDDQVKQGKARAAKVFKETMKGASSSAKAMLQDAIDYVNGKKLNPSKDVVDYVNEELVAQFKSLMPTGPMIYPVYVKAEKAFDYENKQNIEELANTKSGKDLYPEELAKIKNGSWDLIEKPHVQRAIREAGFDSFYVKEGTEKNLAVYSSDQIKSAIGNVGAYGQRPITAEEAGRAGMTEEEAAEAQKRGDIRFSLRSSARWSDERIKRLLNQYSYTQDGREDTTKAYAAFIRPEDFLKATTTKEYRAELEAEKTPLDVAKMAKEDQEIFLEIKPTADDGVYQIVGHEGRHRMMAMRDAGVTAAPVTLVMRPYGAIENAQVVEEPYFKPQQFGDSKAAKGFSAMEMIPISWNQRQNLKDTFGGEAPVKFSIRDKKSVRNNLSPATKSEVERITTARYEPGFVERITKALAPESFSKFRAQALNRYNQLSVYDKLKAKKMGGVELLADQSAEAAALMSDLGAGVTAQAMGVHDRVGGIPVYRKGYTTVSNEGGTVKGIIAIFAPLAKYGDPEVYRDFQFWAGSKRGSRFLADGKEQLYTPANMKQAQEILKVYPEFESIFKEWTKYNEGLVKYMVDTGVISAENGKKFVEHSDYIPFYRQIDGETTVGPNIFQSISGVKAPKKLKGGEQPLADFLETIVRNTQASIQAGLKNVAAQRAVKLAEDIGEAERLPNVQSGVNVVTVLENGMKVSYDCRDHLFINAVKSLNLPDLPFIGLLAGPANLLRNLVTKDPGFMLANMMRDSMSAMVTSGVNMTPIVSTIKNFGDAIAGKSPEYDALLKSGVLGGYDYSAGVEQSAQKLAQELRKEAKVSTTAEKLMRPATWLWEALEKGTEASDAATRIEVYKQTLKETGNEAEAIFRSLEVMNFNRKGSSAVIRIATAAIPFLNARMQGLDILYRAAISPSLDVNATERAKRIQKTFFVRGMTIAALSCMYWMMTHDDDEYKKQEQETRDNYWLFPGLGIKIPIPFEVGIIFKVIPERIMAYTFGDDTGKDFMKSMKRNFENTLPITPMGMIPQLAKPYAEVTMNYSLFTGRPIIGQGMETVDPKYQSLPMTATFLKDLGKELNISPIKMEYLIRGYTGTMGAYMVDAIDSIYNMHSDAPKAAKRFEQMPVLKRFAIDPDARGSVTAYYDLKNATATVVRTSNYLERSQNYEEYAKYLKENMGTLAVHDYVLDMGKTLDEFNEYKQMIRGSKMDAEKKREALLQITRVENKLTANIQQLRKMANQ